MKPEVASFPQRDAAPVLMHVPDKSFSARCKREVDRIFEGSPRSAHVRDAGDATMIISYRRSTVWRRRTRDLDHSRLPGLS